MKLFALLFLSLSIPAHAELSPQEKELQKKVCQVEILEIPNANVVEGVLRAGEFDAQLKSMCTGVIIGPNQFRSNQHCIPALGFDQKTHTARIGRIVCNGGKEIHQFTKKSVINNPLYKKEDRGEWDYLKIITDEQFSSTPAPIPENGAEVTAALIKGSCIAFGYADKREADGIKARKIITTPVTAGLKQSFIDAGVAVAKNVVYLGYQNNIHPGDSGGPLFCKNVNTDKYILVGTLTANTPLSLKWNVDPSSVSVVLPDGTPLKGNTLYINASTLINQSLSK